MGAARNRLLADIARIGGAKLLDMAVTRAFPTPKDPKRSTPAPEDLPDSQKQDSSVTKGLAATAVSRIATRSIPGAIIVGGGVLAKALYDRRRRRRKGRSGRA